MLRLSWTCFTTSLNLLWKHNSCLLTLKFKKSNVYSFVVCCFCRLNILCFTLCPPGKLYFVLVLNISLYSLTVFCECSAFNSFSPIVYHVKGFSRNIYNSFNRWNFRLFVQNSSDWWLWYWKDVCCSKIQIRDFCWKAWKYNRSRFLHEDCNCWW